MTLTTLIDAWQDAVGDRALWPVLARHPGLDDVLDAPLDAESVVDFQRRAVSAARAAEIAGEPSLAARLRKARFP